MKVIVGLSGGVDSSVAAIKLIEEGYDVEALFMRNWDAAINNELIGNPDLDKEVCSQERDYLDAQKVADKLGIILHRHDFVEEYWNDVFSVFLSELALGRTPNPDILCNKYIKFDAFLNVALSLGAQMIATGHFVRTRTINGVTRLLRGADANKDQSYFLSQITQSQLSRCLFPVGSLTKAEVRKIAFANDLETASKKDSTGICFIGERRFEQFIANYLPARPGRIISESKEELGSHCGLMNYTIGQRKGLGIGGSSKYGNEPWFVYGKNIELNELYVCQGFNNPKLLSDKCLVTGMNWIGPIPDVSSEITAKFRYRQKDIPITIAKVSKNAIIVEYPSKSRAVTPGQACVLYDGDVCLGGGTIDKVYYQNNLRHEEV
ncbi:MAG: tRNA 2-thiouridine(34) synthase MnmA [Candidatus Izemoplasmatales bacterium]|jgi:tRNA-specific 2-thiouridylase